MNQAIKIIGITKFQRNVKKTMDELKSDDNAVILTRDSEPEAVITSYNTYQNHRAAADKLAREEIKALVSQIQKRNKNIPEEEVIADLEEAKEKVRNDSYHRR